MAGVAMVFYLQVYILILSVDHRVEQQLLLIYPWGGKAERVTCEKLCIWKVAGSEVKAMPASPQGLRDPAVTNSSFTHTLVYKRQELVSKKAPCR